MLTLNRPVAGVDRARLGLAAVLVFAAVAQALMVTSEPQLGNGDYYLRNAVAVAHGHLPHSRYSPGFAFLLAPLAAVFQEQRHLLLAASALTAVLAVAGLFLTHRVLRQWLTPAQAVLALAPFAVGQAVTTFLGHGEVESTCLVLVSLVLLAMQRGRWELAALLTLLTLLVRLPLAPFFGVLWLCLARRHLRAAGLAALGAALAVAAQLATGPVQEQNYLQIGQSSYGGGASDPVVKLLHGVANRLVNYTSVGLPRLVLPARLLSGPGMVLGLLVTAVLVRGAVQLVKGWRVDRLGAAGQLALAGQVAVLLLWPVRPAETARMIIPLAPLILLALVAGVRAVPERWPLVRRCLPAGVVVVVALGLVSSGLLVRQSRQGLSDEQNFVAAHLAARAAGMPEGTVVSRKAGYSELALGRRAVEYPQGATADSLASYARQVGACAFVVDGLDEGLSPALAAWVRGQATDTLGAVGATAVVSYPGPGCPPSRRP